MHVTTAYFGDEKKLALKPANALFKYKHCF